MLDLIALQAGFHISTGRLLSMNQELGMPIFVMTERKTRVKQCTVSFHAVPSQSTKLIKITWKMHFLLFSIKKTEIRFLLLPCMSLYVNVAF